MNLPKTVPAAWIKAAKVGDSIMSPRRIRIKNWLALCFCQLERRPVTVLAVNYLNPQGELFNENKT